MSESNLVIKDLFGGFNGYKKKYKKHLAKTIYNNFKTYNYILVKHTIEDINKFISSGNIYSILIYKNNKIIGYLFGEIISLNTNTNKNKTVFLIRYIYVYSELRNTGIGSKLIEIVIDKINKWNIDGAIVICDIDNSDIQYFFNHRGFTIDKTYQPDKTLTVLSYNL